MSDLVEAWRQRRDDLLRQLPERDSGFGVEIAMSQAFGRLSDDERAQLEPLLREWLQSGDERDRRQAVAIIREHKVTSMADDLRGLLDRLEASGDVASTTEAARVDHALGRLAPSDDIVDEWRRGREQLIAELSEKDTGVGVTVAMSQAYGRLSDDERVRLEVLLREWLRSDWQADRSDARKIIDDHHVTSMIGELRALQERLEASTEIGAPYEWAATNRVLGRLVAGSGAADA